MPSILLSLVLVQSAPLEMASSLLERAQYEQVGVVLAPYLADKGVPPADRARGHVLLGISLHNLHDEASARLAFGRALELDAGIALPAGVSPRTAAVFADSKRAVVVVSPAPAAVLPGPPVASASVSGRRWAAVAAFGVTAAAAAIGAGLIARGLTGRAQADRDPEAASAERRFQEAQTFFRWGSGVAFAAGATLLVGLVLFLWPAENPSTLTVTPSGVEARF